jgi:hypothetical protein
VVVSKYSGAVATAVWTLGWIACAYHAFWYAEGQHAGAAYLNLAITTFGSVLGCVITTRLFRRIPEEQPEKKTESTESRASRIAGWFGLVVWCAAGVVWNMAVYWTVVRAVGNGQAVVVLMLIPFSVIGWFLLNVLFVSIGILIDSFLDRDETVKKKP